jgi:hypothetical protein
MKVIYHVFGVFLLVGATSALSYAGEYSEHNCISINESGKHLRVFLPESFGDEILIQHFSKVTGELEKVKSTDHYRITSHGKNSIFRSADGDILISFPNGSRDQIAYLKVRNGIFHGKLIPVFETSVRCKYGATQD